MMRKYQQPIPEDQVPEAVVTCFRSMVEISSGEAGWVWHPNGQYSFEVKKDVIHYFFISRHSFPIKASGVTIEHLS